MNSVELTSTENEILNLSREKFHWKTEGQFDQLADLFDDDLKFVHITGHVSSKSEWIEELKSERFIYNSIDFEEATVTVVGEKATLEGRAIFNVTFHGSKGTYKLAYTEEYMKRNGVWKLLNLYTRTF